MAGPLAGSCRSAATFRGCAAVPVAPRAGGTIPARSRSVPSQPGIRQGYQRRGPIVTLALKMALPSHQVGRAPQERRIRGSCPSSAPLDISWGAGLLEVGDPRIFKCRKSRNTVAVGFATLPAGKSLSRLPLSQVSQPLPKRRG